MRTFDVFETVLVRRIGRPADVHLLVGGRSDVSQLTGLAPAAFAELRAWTEHDQRLARQSGEVSLDDIVEALGRSLRLSARATTTLMQAELEVEASLLTANPQLVRSVEDSRRRFGKVLWLTDTYFSSEWIAGQLARFGMLEEGDEIFASNERGVSKLRGGLFEVAANVHAAAGPRFEHVGNDPIADLQRAKAAGWSVRPELEANPNRYEALLSDQAAATRGLGSLLAGASILTRLARPPSVAAGRWTVGASVAGPCLCAFVLWLLLRAEELGLGKLYFVARDGEILLSVGKILQSGLGVAETVELRYLYGSRQAWHLPALDLAPSRGRGWLRENAEESSLEAVLARVGLTVAQTPTLEGLVPRGEKLGPERADFVVDSLLGGEDEWQAVCAAAATARGSLIGYLERENVLSTEEGLAFVDLGWIGRSLNSLDLVLRSVGHPGASNFFFGLHQPPGEFGAPQASEVFFRDWRHGQPATPGTVSLLEAFCAGTEGQTTGYGASPDYEPVLTSALNEETARWGLGEVHAAVTCYAREAVTALADLPRITVGDVLGVRRGIERSLELLWTRPSAPEARAWVTFPYSESQTHEGSNHLGRQLTWREAARVLRSQPDYPLWIEGSLAASAKLPAQMTKLLWAADRRRRRMASAARARLTRRARSRSSS